MRFLPRDADAAWLALFAAARLTRPVALQEAATFGVDATGGLKPLPVGDGNASLCWDPECGWTLGVAATSTLTELAELYLPLVSARTGRPLVVGHLGQSLDGYVATATGDAHYVNGPENLVHLHRLRALSDAVLVGAGTVAADAPRLTTRLVPGDNPQRVVLDPRGRLPRARRVFTDGAAPTLVVRAVDGSDATAGGFGRAEILAVPARDGCLDLAALLAALRARGLHVLLVEGGGDTVSRFLSAGLLDRLQVAVAPLVIGDGRPGVRVAGGETLRDCLRLACRAHRMGEDVLFDCDLRSEGRPKAQPGERGQGTA